MLILRTPLFPLTRPLPPPPPPPPPVLPLHHLHSSLFSYSRNRLNHCSQGAVKIGCLLIDDREAGKVQGENLTVKENT